MEIREKVIELILFHLGIKDANQRLNANDDLIQLGMNSLNFIQLVVSIENEFDIEFEDEDIDHISFSSLDTLCTYVGEKMDIASQ